MTGEQILALPMTPNDAKAATVREYLCRLALGVVLSGEGFCGKRPFGNSDWQVRDLGAALVLGGAISGELVDGYWAEFDWREYRVAIMAACRALEKS